jgi:hypothetical protein
MEGKATREVVVVRKRRRPMLRPHVAAAAPPAQTGSATAAGPAEWVTFPASADPPAWVRDL